MPTHHSTTPDTNKLTLLQWNVRGLLENWHELKHHFLTEQASILCLQETHLKPTDPYNLNLPNYTLIRKDAVTAQTMRRRGSVGIYIQNHIPFKTVATNTDLEIQAIQININHSTITIVNMYAPQSIDFDDFMDDLERFLNNITTPIILCGDINAHHPIWDKSRPRPDTRGTTFNEYINRKNLVIINTGAPTFPAVQQHHTDTTPDITACTAALSLITTWQTDTNNRCSDHRPIHITIGHNTTPLNREKRYNLKRADWKGFTDEIENTNIPEPTVDDITNLMIQTANNHIPQTRTYHHKPKAAPWWNYNCKRAITFRNTAKRRYEREKTQENLLIYQKAKARCRKLIKEAKRTSFQEITNQFNRFTPLSKIWQTVRAFKNNKTPSRKAIIITHNDTSYSSPEDISLQFANHYLSLSSQCDSPTTPILDDSNDDNTQSYNLPLSLQELENALSRTGNTAPGPDQIHYHLFKNLGKKGKQTLLKALNSAFLTHSYPQSWFHAHIIPIPKPSKDTSKLESYRPISLTNTIHKIFERIIKERLLYIIQKENLIIPEQCGFLPGRNTLDNLVQITSDIKLALSSKSTVAALFLDLKNAYDTLNIQPLLDFLKQKISGHILPYQLPYQPFLPSQIPRCPIRIENTYLRPYARISPQPTPLHPRP